METVTLTNHTDFQSGYNREHMFNTAKKTDGALLCCRGD